MGRCGKIPNHLHTPAEQGKFFISCAATRAETAAARFPEAPLAPVVPEKGEVQVSPVTETEPALSYQPETVGQGRGEAAPLIDLVQARRCRRAFEERGQPGENFQQNEFGTGPIWAQGA